MSARLYPIIKTSRNAIVPMFDNPTSKLDMHGNRKIFIMNPVFNIIVEEEKEEENNGECVICLEEVQSFNKVQPCKICKVFMHEKCFIEYSKSKNTNPIKCVTCDEQIKLEDIDLELQLESLETQIQNANNLDSDYMDEYNEDDELVVVVKKGCICFGIVIMVVLICFLIYIFPNGRG
tara:strand:- start:723 stop:1256 length:534 start_codon:yes stop_codon:yes gene_type:complete